MSLERMVLMKTIEHDNDDDDNGDDDDYDDDDVDKNQRALRESCLAN